MTNGSIKYAIGQSNCPARDTLREWFERRAGDAHVADDSVLAHLVDCRKCSSVLAEIVDDSITDVEIQEAARDLGLPLGHPADCPSPVELVSYAWYPEQDPIAPHRVSEERRVAIARHLEAGCNVCHKHFTIARRRKSATSEDVAVKEKAVTFSDCKTKPVPIAVGRFDTLAELIKRGAKDISHKQQDLTVVPYRCEKGLPEDHLCWLVQHGYLILAPEGYRLPQSGRGVPGFAQRLQEEAREKAGIGHATVLHLEEHKHDVLGVDAGSTTLHVLSAITYRDRPRKRYPSEIHTNSLCGLASGADLELNAKWIMFQGERNCDSNAVIVQVRDLPRRWRPSAVVVGVNALSSDGRFSTLTGKCETPLKEYLIERATNEVYFVLSPKKFGASPVGVELKASVNLPHLIRNEKKRVTIVTALPLSGESDGRTERFLRTIEHFVRPGPCRPNHVTLYAIPSDIHKMTDCERLKDTSPEECDIQPQHIRRQIEAFRQRHARDVICVSLEF